MISFKQFCESSFAEIPGKQENRQMEFAMLRKKGILSQLSNRNTISVFSLPAEYAYELYLSKVTGKQIISFGTDYNLPNLVKNARIVAGTGKIIPFVTSTAANINKIIINPEAYSFYKVDPIRGHTSESVILPKDLDVIDLDYTRIPLSPSMNLGKKLGGNSFIYVTKAAQFLKPNGIICVTFLLEYRGSNYLTTTRDPEYQDLIKKHEIQPGEPFKAKPIKYHLKAIYAKYIFQKTS